VVFLCNVAVSEFILQGVMKALNVNKLTRSGCVFKFWVADWCAQLSNKMGGDLKKIQTVGRYMIEVWKAVGMELDRVEFLWSSEEINARPGEYWPLVMDIACRNNLAEIIRLVNSCGTLLLCSVLHADGLTGQFSNVEHVCRCFAGTVLLLRF